MKSSKLNKQCKQIKCARYTGDKNLFKMAKPFINRLIYQIHRETGKGPYSAKLNDYLKALEVIAKENNEEAFRNAVIAVCMIAENQKILNRWRSILQNKVFTYCINHGFNKIKLLDFKVHKKPDEIRKPPVSLQIPLSAPHSTLILNDLTELPDFIANNENQQHDRNIMIKQSLLN